MKKLGIYALVALGVISYNVITSANRDSTGAIVSAGSVDAFQIRVGDCFDDSDSMEEVSSLPGVPCSEPHDNEAYAVFNVDIDTYPDDYDMWEMAHDACLERFEPFVGRDYDSSILDVYTLYPTAESFAQNDREIVCAVYHIDAEKLVGSVKGRGM